MHLYQSRLKDQIIHSVDGVSVHAEGGVYTDAISGMFNVPFGYSCQPIKQRIAQALDVLPFHPKDHFYSPEWLETGSLLLQRAKLDDGALLFVNSGSEAIEASITLALEYHRRRGHARKRKVVSRRHSYHGATLGAHSVTGRNDFAELRHSGYDTIRIHPPFPVTHQGRPLEPHGAADVEQLIQRSGPDEIACLILEPVNHLKGMQACPGEYLAGIRALCDRHDIVMITDEIVTGASRTGEFLHTHHFGVTPDIVALGKGISGGYYPTSVMATSARIASVFDTQGPWIPFGYSHTYASNPVSIAAVGAALQVLAQVETSGQLQRLIVLAGELTRRLAAHDGVARAEASGLLIGLTLDERLGPQAGKRLEQLCFARGLILRGEENWACLAPAYVMPEATLAGVFEVLHASIDQL